MGLEISSGFGYQRPITNKEKQGKYEKMQAREGNAGKKASEKSVFGSFFRFKFRSLGRP